MQKVRLYSSKKILCVFLILCIVWASLIFYMSNEPATDSAERSGGIVDAVTTLLVSGFDNLDEAEKAEVKADLDFFIRKTAHFCIFAMLGILFAFAFMYVEATWIFHIVSPFVGGTLYAVSDEVHQYFVPGRGPRVTDVFLDSAGVLCGILFVSVVSMMIIKRTRK